MASDEQLPSPKENVKPQNYRELWQARKITSQFADPCQAAREASIKCMERNADDKSLCSDYFQAFRDCKEAFLDQLKEDRRSGKPRVY